MYYAHSVQNIIYVRHGHVDLFFLFAKGVDRMAFTLKEYVGYDVVKEMYKTVGKEMPKKKRPHKAKAKVNDSKKKNQ